MFQVIFDVCLRVWCALPGADVAYGGARRRSGLNPAVRRQWQRQRQRQRRKVQEQKLGFPVPQA